MARLIERRTDVAELLSRAVAERTVGLDQAQRSAGPAAKEAAVETLSAQLNRLMRDMFTRRKRPAASVGNS